MKKILAIVLLSAVAAFAQAQEAFQVATGDPKTGSVYSKMFGQFTGYCGAGLNLVETPSNGSVDNISLLSANKVKAAFVQSDLLFFYQAVDPNKVKNIKTLFSLYPEELHFVARASKKEGGVWGLGASTVEFKTVSQLAGRSIGTTGGSANSARIFASKSGYPITVKEYLDGESMLKALRDGAVDAVLMVGGAPNPAVEALPAGFRILEVDAKTVTALTTGAGALYRPAKLTYSKLGAAGVNTVSAEALFVTRTFRSPEVIAKLQGLRDCFNAKLTTIQDATGTHPKWQDVATGNKGMWSYYDLTAK